LRRSAGESASKGEEVTGGWRRLHKEDINNLYSKTYITGRII
jgi:hypothetical protein